MRAALKTFAAWLILAGLPGCARTEVVPSSPPSALKETGHVAEDTAPKNDLRLVPAEAYMRTYLQLFGGLAPLDVQERLKAKDGGKLFDAWDDYLSALGFPDYRLDLPRATQTNTLMMAAFERLGVALCDRAVEHDLEASPPTPLGERLIFVFDAAKEPVDAAAFAPQFEVLHRTFLSYPTRFAPSDRVPGFFELYSHTAQHHSEKGVKSRFTPAEAGWAAVCYGLVRHPEFHLY